MLINMREQTQKERVIERLKTDGCVDNFWAFHNYILRLGAIIHGLREDGWNIDGRFGVGNHSKNFIYTLLEEPPVSEPITRKHISI